MTTENEQTDLTGIQEIEQENVQNPRFAAKPKEEVKEPLVESPKDEFVDPDNLVELLDAENEAAHAAEDVIRLEAPVSHEYEGAAAAYAQDAADIAKVAGIPPSEMNVLFNFIADGAIMAAEADANATLHPAQIPGPDLANRSLCMTTLTRRFGTMTDQIVKDSAAEFRNLPESVQRWLDTPDENGRLLSNHPEVVIALALKRNGFTKLSPEAAQKELNVLRSQKSLDPLAKAKIKMLALVAATGKIGEHAGLKRALAEKSAPKPVAKTAREKLTAELRTIRQDKHYYSKDSPNHAALVARVNAIYAELHGGGA